MARIAVVDDDAHLRKLLSTMLTRRGHEPVTFPDGAAALLELRKGGFQLVLSDVQMPNLDGISLCKALRENYGKSQLPIVLLSVLDKEDDILRAMEAGASDYLVKPYSLALLQAKISLHLKPRQRDKSATVKIARPKVLLGEPSTYPYPFDRYDLLKVIGRGGYARVYQAKHVLDGEVVAVKLLERDINHDREGLARYFREVALLNRVKSPNVVGIRDSGFEQWRYYLAMDFVSGESVDTIIGMRGGLSVAFTLSVGAQVANAIAALAELGLVHRDIKPGNVIVTPEGHAKLVDFGLAKRGGDQGLTSPDDIMGTPDYIAPEILQGEAEHPGSGVYSLGVTMYEMLTAAAPFPGKTPYEILVNVASGKPLPPVHTLRPDVPAEISETLALITHPDPRQRLMEPRQTEQVLTDLLTVFSE